MLRPPLLFAHHLLSIQINDEPVAPPRPPMLEYRRTGDLNPPECTVSAGHHPAETIFYFYKKIKPADSSARFHNCCVATRQPTHSPRFIAADVLLVFVKQRRPSSAVQLRMMGALHTVYPSIAWTLCLSRELMTETREDVS